MSESPVTADLIRAFNLLIHDLRAPLSVANGYLRLLREDRLPSPEDRDRAFGQTTDALGRISRLCADASTLVHSYEAAPPAGTRVPARLLADQVSQAIQEQLPASIQSIPDNGMLRLASLDTVAGAIAAIVTAVAGVRPRPDRRVTIDACDEELRVLLGAADDHRLLVEGPRQAFDPWRGHGLAIPCACRTVERNGGTVWAIDGRQGVVGMALPLEVSR
jgi:signal transduction histidine kinase